MLKRLRKINKVKLIESSRRVSHKAQPNIPLPKAYAALLATGVPKAKALMMVQDAATKGGLDTEDLWGVVAWCSTPFEKDWRAAALKL